MPEADPHRAARAAHCADAPPLVWALGNGRALSLDRGRTLAILNVTPDSFSDGGAHASPEAAADAAVRMLEAGADMLDVGGESTRPGAPSVPEAAQIARVAPVIRAIRARGVAAPIGVDTTRAAVALAALDAGADAVNDQSGGTDDEAMLALVARRGVGLILMHRLRAPRDDRYADRHEAPPRYEGGVAEAVRAHLAGRAQAAERAGVRPSAIALDPGLGFGKTVEQNFALIGAIGGIVALGYAVVCGASRKSFLGAVSGQGEPARRIAESVAAAALLREGGAHVLRVHDVGETAAALRVADAARASRIA